MGRSPGFNLAARPPAYPRTGSGVAIILAGISSLQVCADEPERTRRINVTGVIEHCVALAARGWRICYVSSAGVFDGHTPWPVETTPTNPTTEYGDQRATVERALLHLFNENTTILRLTKYLELPYLPWSVSASGEAVEHPVRAFSDVHLAPLSLRAILNQARTIIHEPGIHHLSPAFECSYATLAARLWPMSNVQPVSGAATMILPATHPGLGTRHPALTKLRAASLDQWISDVRPNPSLA